MSKISCFRLGALLLLSISIFGVHFVFERFETIPLLLTYLGAFIAYVYLIRSRLDIKWVFLAALGLRVMLCFGAPSLSEDVYRFIWDGHLMHAGIHPFSVTPEDLTQRDVDIAGQTDELYELLNSKIYYTIYPPISQLIFWLATFSLDIFTSITIMRIILILFELGTFYLIYRLFDQSRSGTRLAIYALNPLVILELIGNLHFEGIIVFFTILGIRLAQKHKLSTGLAIGAGIATKLTPVMFLPLFLKVFGAKKSIWIYLLATVFVIAVTLPLVDLALFRGMGDSLSLFFKSFEFNASIFFIVREIGILWVGYDIVQTAGPVLSLCSLSIILIFSFGYVHKNTNLFKAFSIILLIQLLFATTVHPWYIIPLIGLAAGSNYLFPIVWSFFIFMTYAGYSGSGFEHPLFFIIIEYLILGYFSFEEIFRNKKFIDIHE